MDQTTVKRVIGPWTGTAVVAGSMLGIGIFLSPPIVADNMGTATGYYVMWIVGGLVSLAGAVACAELGAMLPRAGGDYVFQYEAYGPSVAFASAVVLFVGIFCGSIAAMAYALCQYQLSYLLGIDLSSTGVTLLGTSFNLAQLFSVAIIVALTVLNVCGTSPSARFQLGATLVPLVLLALASTYALSTRAPIEVSATGASAGALTSQGLVSAFLAVYFAYSGWINIIYVAGEVKAPHRNIPVALIGGTVLVSFLYLLLTHTFVHVLGLEGVAHAGEAGTAVASKIWGDLGKSLFAMVVAVAIIASINSTVLGGARIIYALANKNPFVAVFKHIDKRGIPRLAVLSQGFVAVVFVLTGTFEQLYLMSSLAMLVTGSLTVGSIFVLRIKQPHRPRPYRATWYPLVPAIYLFVAIGILTISTYRAFFGGATIQWYPLIGLLTLLAAYCFHRLQLMGQVPGK